MQNKESQELLEKGLSHKENMDNFAMKSKMLFVKKMTELAIESYIRLTNNK